MTAPTKIFLTAEWRHLLMLNYAVDPELLWPLIPTGTELDRWNGKTYVSLVGFLFLGTRLFGIPVPFHSNFEEVNLRFYVRRDDPSGGRRGVVFVKEIVPRWAIAAVARRFYHEKYISAPMGHRRNDPTSTGRGLLRYEWRCGQSRYALGAGFSGASAPSREGSEEEFITEHYWGYTRCPNGRTLEYKVEHPRWSIWRAEDPFFEGDAARLYGDDFGECLRAPTSALIADGSLVRVFCARAL